MGRVAERQESLSQGTFLHSSPRDILKISHSFLVTIIVSKVSLVALTLFIANDYDFDWFMINDHTAVVRKIK